MNILFNTPLLKTDTLRHEFDNKILIVFVVILAVSVILSLLFLNLAVTFSKPPVDNEVPQNNIQGILYA